MHAFLVTRWEGEPVNAAPGEHDDLRWFRPSDLADLKMANAASLSSILSAVQVVTDQPRRTYQTNVFGVLAVTNAFLPLLRRSTHPRIVNISSGTGSLTWSSGPNPQFDFRLPARVPGLPTVRRRPR